MNRDTFLNNIKQSLKTSVLPQAHQERPILPVLADFKPDDLLPQFIQEATNLKGIVYQAPSDKAAYDYIIDVFGRHQTVEFMAWDNAYIPLNNLISNLDKNGYIQYHSTIPKTAKDRWNTYNRLMNVVIGLTGAMAALADTGSLVLQSHKGQGRLASLLAPVHIAILEKTRLFPSMAHFIQANPNAAKQSSNLIFISGPSRTADIEQTLTLGVHGPKELHIIVL